MTPLMLLSLLGMSLFLPALMGSDDAADTADPEDDTLDPMEDKETDVTFTGPTIGTDGLDQFPGFALDTEDLQFDLQDGDDLVRSGSGNDLISGGAGDDDISGNFGDDTIFGGLGDDSILDGSGDNLINGGAGDDTITLGWQSTVTGGDGADTFSLAATELLSGPSSGDSASGPAVITDFDPEEDTISALSLSLQRGAIGSVALEDNEDASGVDFRLNDRTLLTVEGAQVADFDDLAISLAVEDNGQITGSDRDETIAGYYGSTLNGGAGDDFVYSSSVTFTSTVPTFLNGDAGNDTVISGGPTIFDQDEGEEPGTVRNVLSGGAGDDLVYVLYSGILTGGEGADQFAISSPSLSSRFTEITDFDPREDQLFVIDDTASPDDYSLTVWDDNAGADLLLNDRLIARITGGQNLTSEDILYSDAPNPFANR